MTFIARLIREPLVQFLLIGVAIFAIYDLVASQSEPPRDRAGAGTESYLRCLPGRSNFVGR